MIAYFLWVGLVHKGVARATLRVSVRYVNNIGYFWRSFWTNCYGLSAVMPTNLIFQHLAVYNGSGFWVEEKLKLLVHLGLLVLVQCRVHLERWLLVEIIGLVCKGICWCLEQVRLAWDC
jgi:hypothetical protein